MSTSVEDKYVEGGKCPYCKGYRMVNSHTGQPFRTCFACRFKCPGTEGSELCNEVRGKSPKGNLYPICSKCKYGSNFKTRDQLKSAATEEAATIEPVLPLESADSN